MSCMPRSRRISPHFGRNSPPRPRRRGDADTAKQITAARRPTTAAHVVNLLVLNDASARGRLTDLGERLRAAHAGMDGSQIRELTAQQRRLIDELARAAFEEADLSGRRPRCVTTSPPRCRRRSPTRKSPGGSAGSPRPSSGRASASSATPQSFSSPPAAARPQQNPSLRSPRRTIPQTKSPATTNRPSERRRRQEARATLAAAERAKAEADDALNELQADLATARLRRDDARRRLQDAESALTAAEDAYEQAKQAGRDAAAVVKEAKARLK